MRDPGEHCRTRGRRRRRSGICCGLPVLLSLGVLGAVAGVSLQSWALIGVGLVLVVLGWVTRVRRRRCPASDVNETANNPLKENRR